MCPLLYYQASVKASKRVDSERLHLQNSQTKEGTKDDVPFENIIHCTQYHNQDVGDTFCLPWEEVFLVA